MAFTCPTCGGDRYDTRGDWCPTCGGRGNVQPTPVEVQPPLWLHLPTRLLWINPSLIERVYGWHAEDDAQRIVAYSIYLTGRDDNGEGNVEIDDPADVAAVTAWLEVRS